MMKMMKMIVLVVFISSNRNLLMVVWLVLVLGTGVLEYCSTSTTNSNR